MTTNHKAADRLVPLVLLIASAVLSASCSGTSTAGDSAPNANATASNAPVGPKLEQDPKTAEARLDLLPKLRGIYTMADIDDGGRVVMVPTEFATIFTFMEDGFYNRSVKRPGREDDTDSGYYRIERGEDGQVSLTLRMIFRRKKQIKDAPEEKRAINLSEEGDVLRITGANGKIAVFRRTASSEPKTLN